MRSISGAFATTVLLVLSLTACTTVPPPHPVVVAPAGVELPIRATVVFEVAPNQRDFNVSSFGPYTWSYRESPLVQAAAMEMMRDLFSDVVASDGPTVNGIVFQISGFTSINPAVSTYFATAIADVFVRTEVGERQIGQYRGTGNAWGRIYSYPPLQAAYATAFSELSQQMLADPTLLKRVRSEAPDMPPRASADFDLPPPGAQTGRSHTDGAGPRE
jgi:hypothetical protein